MFRRLRRIDAKLDLLLLLLTTETRTMATLADVITALNDNTNAVAARMDALLAQIAGGTIKPEDLATLQAISDHLKQLGANPSNPVPPAFPAGSADAKAAPAAAVQGPTPNAQTLQAQVVVAPTAPVAAAPLGDPTAVG